MKVHILGSRNAFRASAYEDLKTAEAVEQQRKRDSGWLGIDLDMDHIPDIGENITLDGGSGYTVTRRHWFVNTEIRSTDEWSLYGDIRSPGYVEVVHLNVEPEGYEAHSGDRFAEGRDQVRESVRKILDGNPDPAAAIAVIRYYLEMS